MVEVFTTTLKKPEGKGALTLITIPFNAAEVFNLKKGNIKVKGTINGIAFRTKLIPKGKGNYVMAVDKKLQTKLDFSGSDMDIEVQIEVDEAALYGSGDFIEIKAGSDHVGILEAIKTRRSIRSFLPKEIETEVINKILEAGFCAPSSKGKRPWHFIVVTDKVFLRSMALCGNYISFNTTPCCIIVCGDRNINGINEFLIEDCAAAIQNILLAAHGLGLGATWHGLIRSGPNSANTNYKEICKKYKLPEKIIPIAAIALGYPDFDIRMSREARYDLSKVHWNKW